MSPEEDPEQSPPPTQNSLDEARETALACLHAGIDAADPERVIPDAIAIDRSTLTIDPPSSESVDSLDPATARSTETIDLDDFDRLLVLGAGNAAGRAARAIETVLGDRIDAGMVITDAPAETERIEQLPGDHPVPSKRGVESTRRLLSAARDADAGTLALLVMTGGGSALMPAPADGIDLADLQQVTDDLLRSGAPIEDVNAVRKHLSDVKGGRLAEALTPARVVTLVFSDVVGNPLDVVASGPTVPDPTTYQDAIDALERYDVTPPDAVLARLRAGVRGEYPETPSTDHPAFERSSVHVVADNFTACDAARTEAVDRGYEATLLTTRVTGPAREAARWHSAIAHEIRDTGNPIDPPAVVVTGGETTVRVTGDGTGGPNLEFALAAALDLPEHAIVAAIDTDGIDGNSGVAGALVTDRTVDDPEAAATALDDHDSYGFLAERDAVIETGVTGTNVNDLRVLVLPTRPDTEDPG